MNKPIKPPKKDSKAKDLPLLFKKHKKLLSTHYHFTPFEEPIMLFERRNGNIEFKEKATTGKYHFKHTDGQERYIIITGKPKNYQFGTRTVRGYYCHEDHPFPLPNDPLMDTEQFNLIIEKTLHDKKEWDTKLTREKTKMIWAIAGAICAIIGAVILYKILVQPIPTPTSNTIAQAVKNNATMIINKSTITVLG